MATLHGILAELGIEPPQMHPEREIADQAAWRVNEAFTPVPGHCYELAFGKLFFDGQHRHVIKRVRTDSEQPVDWFDLDDEQPLELELRNCPVKAFRPID